MNSKFRKKAAGPKGRPAEPFGASTESKSSEEKKKPAAPKKAAAKRTGVAGGGAPRGPLGPEDVVHALRAASRSVHVMELITLLERDKSEKEAVRHILEELAGLGLAKELPGNKFRYVQPRSGDPEKMVRSARRDAQRQSGELPPKPTREGTAKPREIVVKPHELSAKSEGPAKPRERMAARDGAKPREPARDALTPREATKAALPQANVRAQLTGWLSMTPRGFGFVTCDDGGPDAFIAPPSLNGAMHGDRVELRVRPSAKGREGDILNVLERGLRRVAGTLVKSRSSWFVEPRDPRLPERFIVEGALPLDTPEGSEVVAQVTRHPDRFIHAERGDIGAVRVLRVLGTRGTANVEIEKVLIREGVIEEFPEDVVAEALGFPAQVPQEEIARRVDLRSLDLCTIDPEDARDHDDAVWAEKNSKGYRVVIAIADVSHYVRPGSPIDVEALKRATSIYLPDRAIPMLPPELSTNLASLVDTDDRLTLAVDCQLDATGRSIDFRFVEGVMRSRARLTYGGVARALGWTENPPVDPEAQARLPLLNVLAEVSGLLRARREKRGALAFELPESKIKLGPDREPVDVVQQKGDAGVKKAYETIEDLMLLANETVGGELARRSLAAPFRVHGKPDAARVMQFAQVAEAFGLALPEDAVENPKALQEVLAQIAGTPHEGALGYLLLRSMQQAIYSLDNVGHFALAAKDYLHFTSPIRRYPDLVVHRIVRALARGEQIDQSPTAIQARRIEAIQSSRMERRAMTVERDAKALCATLIMQPKVGENFAGVVSGLSPEMIFVTLDAPFVEASIPLDRVDGNGTREAWSLDGLGIRAYAGRSGRSIALGDRVEVKLETVSLADRKSYASLIAITKSEAPTTARVDRPATEKKAPRGKAPRGDGPPKKKYGGSARGGSKSGRSNGGTSGGGTSSGGTSSGGTGRGERKGGGRKKR